MCQGQRLLAAEGRTRPLVRSQLPSPAQVVRGRDVLGRSASTVEGEEV